MQWQLIVGPLIRQVVQWGGGAALGAGVMMESDVTALVGALTSLINIGFVVYARIKAGK